VACAGRVSLGTTNTSAKNKGSSNNVGTRASSLVGGLIVGSTTHLVANPRMSSVLLFSRHSSLPQLSLINKEHTIETYTHKTFEG
jgi:hypothetical protein